MQRVLVLFAHPAFERSRVNRGLADAARGIEGVTFHDLYETYPDLQIDVAREQRLLVDHDVIVFQHPFYWYSAPAIVKEWLDLVLEHGFAYGHGGTALAGKSMLTVTTTGARAEAYAHGGKNRYTMRELLAPFDQSAHLCGMRYLAPLVVHAALVLDEPGQVAPHAMRYRKLLEALRDGRVDIDRAAAAQAFDESLIHGGAEAAR